MKENNRTFTLFLLLSIGIYLMFYFRCSDQKVFRQHGVIVQAKVVKVLSPNKGGVYFSFFCEFEYQGKGMKAISASSVTKHADYYLGKTLPALYSEQTGTFRLLLTSDDYHEYDREYPSGKPVK